MMGGKKGFGICVAVMAATAILGATAYGVGNSNEKKLQDQTERITLGSVMDTEAKAELTEETETADTAETETDETQASEAAAADDASAKDIEEIPAQTDTQASIPNIQKIAQDVMPAVVSITTQSMEEIDFFGRSYQQEVEGSGSGIIVAKSDTELLIATNNHVVEGADELTVCFTVDMDNEEDEEKKLVSGLVKGTDSSLDLAVVAVKLEDIDDEVADKIGIVQMGDSSDVEVGEWVVAIGNALGYGQSVTFGIVSALDREVTISDTNGTVTNNMIQTDAAINFGNSGGALLDMEGRLIGINSAKAAVTGVEGMGYAIPIDTAKPIIENLMNQTTRSKVDEDKLGALGIIPADVSEEAKEVYNIPVGAFVYKMTDNSAAENAGIRTGDIITKLDETTITSKDELLNRMKYYEAGETVAVTVMRAGENGYEEKVIDVVLGKKSDLETQENSDSRSDSSKEDSDDSYDDSYSYDENQYGQDDNNGYGDGHSDYYYDDDEYGMNDFFRYFGF